MAASSSAFQFHSARRCRSRARRAVRACAWGAATSVLAGASAGAIARLAVAPLDCVKVRLQVQVVDRGASKYRNMGQCFRSIVREEGAAALWKGSVPGVLLWAAYSAVQFGVYEAVRDGGRHLGLDREATQLGALAGSIAGIVATVTTFPLDTLRTILAAQGEPRIYANAWQACSALVSSRGPRGLFAGLGATLVEIIPYSGVEFGVYAACRRVSLGDDEGEEGKEKRKGMGSFASGLLAGSAARLVVHPLDVVKKRFQVSGLNRNLAYGARVSLPRQSNVIGVALGIVETEGMAGLYKGLLPGLLKAAPAAAICFAVYEAIAFTAGER